MKIKELKAEPCCCHFCEKDIEWGAEPLPIVWNFDGQMIYYCGEHAEIGRVILDRFISEKNKLNKIEGYCDEHKLLNKLESQFKSNVGDWYIKFKNTNNYGREVIDLPVLKDDKPIGYIMNVDDNYITGKIWSRYIPIVEEVFADKRVTGFEIVC